MIIPVCTLKSTHCSPRNRILPAAPGLRQYRHNTLDPPRGRFLKEKNIPEMDFFLEKNWIFWQGFFQEILGMGFLRQFDFVCPCNFLSVRNLTARKDRKSSAVSSSSGILNNTFNPWGKICQLIDRRPFCTYFSLYNSTQKRYFGKQKKWQRYFFMADLTIHSD